MTHLQHDQQNEERLQVNDVRYGLRKYPGVGCVVNSVLTIRTLGTGECSRYGQSLICSYKVKARGLCQLNWEIRAVRRYH